MSVTGSNIIQGPATVYVGVFGATEPATIATTPATGWTDCGATDGGIEFQVNPEYSELTVDQVIHVVGRRKTLVRPRVVTALAEATLDNLARAISNSAPVTNVLTGDDGLTAFVPTYGAIILDGLAPGGFRRRFTLRKVLGIEGVGVAYKKDGKTMVPVTWEAHWVSPSIAPYKVEDALS